MTDHRATGAPIGDVVDADLALPLHFESEVDLNAPADAVFTLLDDHSRLSAHMTRPSWMMAGSVMMLEFDASNGRAVGAKISLHGRVLSIPLFVEEIVTERNPPLRKVWNTIGRPQLLVIGPTEWVTRSHQEPRLRICACLSTMRTQPDPFHIGSAAYSAVTTPAGARNA